MYLFLFLVYATTVLGLVLQGKIFESNNRLTLNIYDYLSIVIFLAYLFINIKQSKRSYWILMTDSFLFLYVLTILFQNKWNLFEHMELLFWIFYICLAPFERVFLLVRNAGIDNNYLLCIFLLTSVALLVKQIVIYIKN